MFDEEIKKESKGRLCDLTNDKITVLLVGS